MADDDKMAAEKVEGEDKESSKRKVDEEATTSEKDDSESKESPSKKPKVEGAESKPVAVVAKTTAPGMDDGPYKLQEQPTENNQEQLSKINSPKMVLFGLFPTIKEEKLKPFLEQYGTIKECRLRRAFANLYAAVEYGSTDEAKKAYLALNSAKLLGKSLMLQPQQQPAGQS